MSKSIEDTRNTALPIIPHKVDFDPSNPTEPPIPRREIARQLTATTLEVQRLRKEINTDKLTGLANRTVRDEELPKLLEMARASGEPLAVLAVDADGLKRINDELGHPTGDLSIKALGQAIRAALRPEDIVGRDGGDEFFALMPGLKPLEEQAQEVLNNELRVRIDEKYKELARQAGIPEDYIVGASVGIVTVEELGEDDGPEVMLEKTDQDMYVQKRARAAARKAAPGIDTYDEHLGAA